MQQTKDIANGHKASNATKPKKRNNRNKVFTAPLPDPITKNIEAITLIHAQEAKDIHQVSNVA